MKNIKYYVVAWAQILLVSVGLHAQEDSLNEEIKEQGNPFVQHIFTADPSAHVFEGKMYVYPSHDREDANFFNMTDYHVFSSSDLVNWKDHGKVLDVEDVPWAKEYMWAPDCVYKNGMYYFYFPAKDSVGDFKFGVATSKSPAGPFVAEPEPIKGSTSVDPAVFTDDDGQTYMYYGGGGHGKSKNAWVAKMDESMKQFAEEPKALKGIHYWFEACWMNKVGNTYYLSYSTGAKHKQFPERSTIAYATSDNPYGPFTYQGIVNPYVLGWTNHHSIVEWKGQHYLFYHNSELSGGKGNKRSIAADYLHFNDDGSIHPVQQTKWGIGRYDGTKRIEAENYFEAGGVDKKECSEGGFQVEFTNGDELIFNKIIFDDKIKNAIQFNLNSKCAKGKLTITTVKGKTLGTLKIEKSREFTSWKDVVQEIYGVSGELNMKLIFSGKEGDVLLLNRFEFVTIIEE